MLARLCVGGALSSAAFLLFAAALTSGRTSALPAPATSLLARELTALATATPSHADPPRHAAWTIVKATSAMHCLTVDVRAARLRESVAIARAVVGPVHGRYEEVLVYVWTPGARAPARRVQWTPRGGYVELIMD